jgi:hypothetical protein
MLLKSMRYIFLPYFGVFKIRFGNRAAWIASQCDIQLLWDQYGRIWTKVVEYFKKISGQLEKMGKRWTDFSYSNKYLAWIQTR